MVLDWNLPKIIFWGNFTFDTFPFQISISHLKSRGWKMMVIDFSDAGGVANRLTGCSRKVVLSSPCFNVDTNHII